MIFIAEQDKGIGSPWPHPIQYFYHYTKLALGTLNALKALIIGFLKEQTSTAIMVHFKRNISEICQVLAKMDSLNKKINLKMDDSA